MTTNMWPVTIRLRKDQDQISVGQGERSLVPKRKFKIRLSNRRHEMRRRILLIEEDLQDCKKFAQFFDSYFSVSYFTNGLQGLISAIETKPNIVIINHSLLNVSSIELCRQIQQQLKTMIIITGDALSDEQMIKFYKAGANDVIQQVSHAVLLCKINVLLNLDTVNKDDLQKVYHFGKLRLSKENYKVHYDNKELNFTRKEFSILWLLANKQDSVVSREELIKGVWSYAHLDDDRMIDTHLNRIRKKLKQQNINMLIKTVWGIGYILQSEMANTEAAPLKKIANN
jgi:DNA-binding response OmpR family regulator